MTNDFDALFDKAAQIHGHKCPSLFYGVRLGILAKWVAVSPVERIILEGGSKCIGDGFKSVLQDCELCDKVAVVTDSPACALTIGGAGWQRRFSISPKVRRQINQWNKELPLSEFQTRGVSWLRGLKEDELLCEEEISAQ